jgi:hypothetical protein
MIMKPQKSLLFRQLISAATLSLGFGTLWLLLAFLLGGFALEAWRGPDVKWPDREELVITRDGTPLIKSSPRGYASHESYRGLDARPQPEHDDLIDGVYLTGVWLPNSWFSELDWQSRLKPFVDPAHTSVVWYFRHDGAFEGLGYFAGYDRPTNRLLGFIGVSGFRSDRPPPAEQFPVQSNMMYSVPFWSPSQFRLLQGRLTEFDSLNSPIPPSSVYVPCSDRMLLVDLSTRTVSTAFTADEPIESFGFCPKTSGNRDAPARKPALVVRTTQKIVELNRDHGVIRSFTIPDKSRMAYLSFWYPLDDGQALAQFLEPRRTEGEQNIAPVTLYRIAPDGTLRSQSEVPLQSGMLIWSKQPESTLLFPAFPAPALLPVAESFFVAFINQPSSYGAAVRMMLATSWPSFLAVTILALVLAAIAWRRSRAFGLPPSHQAAWATFVLLFGILGYLGFRLHRRWPPRAACPHCHARAARDREACSWCITAFPPAPPKGIEIFA